MGYILEDIDVLALHSSIEYEIIYSTLWSKKIKTIGDAYMVAGGLPTPLHNHRIKMSHMALDMMD